MSNLALQTFFKAINSLIDSNKQVFTLLILDTYLRIIELNTLSLLINYFAIIMQKAMDEVQKYNTS